jgi:hypothetical protein
MSKFGKIGFLVSALSLIVLVVARFILEGWQNILFVPFVLCLLSFVVAIIVDRKLYLEFLTMRTTKHGMNMGVMIFLALILTVAVNFLAVRTQKTFDLTEEKLHTLSDQTILALKDLDQELEFLIFTKGKLAGDSQTNLKGSFQLYLDASSKVKVRFLDAHIEPELAKRYLKPTDQVAMVVKYGERHINIDGNQLGEEQITSAILKVKQTASKSVYFLTGHGERDIDSEAGEGAKSLADALRGDGFQVNKLNLLAGDKMPDASQVLIILGPKSPMLDQEKELLKSFIEQGGRLLVAADPGEGHNIATFTKTFGIEFRNNFIVNQFQGFGGQNQFAALGLELDPGHEITKKLSGGDNITLFPFASELQKDLGADTAIQIVELVKSFPQAFVLNDPRKAEKDPVRKSFPIALAATGKWEKKDGDKTQSFAAVVFGDSDFVINQYWGQGENKNLILNSVAFLAQEAALVSIRPKTPKATPLSLSNYARYALYISLVVLPLLLIVTSGVVWFRRRGL